MKALEELFHSLRLRIFFVVLIVGIVPIICLKFGVIRSYENEIVSNRSMEIQTQCNSVSNQLITYNYMYDPSSEKTKAE